MAGRFPLLLDEHVPRSLEQALRERGWAVVRVEVVAWLREQGRDVWTLPRVGSSGFRGGRSYLRFYIFLCSA
jgi:hypothetical protein